MDLLGEIISSQFRVDELIAPGSMGQVILKMLAKSPANRFSDVKELFDTFCTVAGVTPKLCRLRPFRRKIPRWRTLY